MWRILGRLGWIVTFALLGCDSSPTGSEIQRHTNRWQPEPVTIATVDDNITVQAHEGAFELALENTRRLPLEWGDDLTLAFSSPLLTAPDTIDPIPPRSIGRVPIQVNRSAVYHLGTTDPATMPAWVSSEITILYDEQPLQVVPVAVGLGYPRAEPIGVAYSFVRIPTDQEFGLIGVFNNSGVDWGTPKPASEHDIPWFSYGAVSQVVLPPGRPGYVSYQINRFGLEPGVYTGELRLLWRGEVVQTVVLEMIVGN